ncbi:MAG: EamA family transporter [Verrucomicrobia bacterium]|nr:EamA family transporter [Verrucomicrobiota bacterium]
MSLLAFGLILAAAFIHAGWNLATKRIGGGVPLAWLMSAANLVIYALPLTWYCLTYRPTVSPLGWVFMAGTGLIHLWYGLALQRGYREGDLSLVYPLARGTGPLLTVVGAIALLGERPSWLGLGGVGLIVAGILLITLGARHSADPARVRRGCYYGLLTGALIATYTLWDKHAVSVLLVPPLVLDYANAVVGVTLLAPAAWRQRDEVRRHLREHPRELAVIGVCRPLSYILILSALTFTPVSVVAPAREISILVGVFFGARLFAEEGLGRRLVASLFMLAGIAAIAAG